MSDQNVPTYTSAHITVVAHRLTYIHVCACVCKVISVPEVVKNILPAYRMVDER